MKRWRMPRHEQRKTRRAHYDATASAAYCVLDLQLGFLRNYVSAERNERERGRVHN